MHNFYKPIANQSELCCQTKFKLLYINPWSVQQLPVIYMIIFGQFSIVFTLFKYFGQIDLCPL